MPLRGLPFRLGLEVMDLCLITRDNGGQETVTISLVTSKQLRADDFSSGRLRGTDRTHTFEYPNW
jgi:hypothetical protein